MKNRVLAQFWNGIGNAVMFTPALQALIELFGCEVDVLCAHRPSVITEILGAVKGAKPRVYRPNFNFERYNIFYSPKHGERVPCYFAIREYCNANNIELLGDRDVNWERDRIHEIDYYMLDLYEKGYSKAIPKQVVPRYMKTVRLRNTGVFYKKKPIRIAFCNGYKKDNSHHRWWRKGWEYFQELGELIEKYYAGEVEIALVGGADDRKWADSLQLKNKITFTRNWTIKDTVLMLDRCDCLVTTDTATMHIGDAMEIPMIALFGPTMVSKNGPKSPKAHILRADMECVPCQGTPNWTICKNPKCMKAIEPSEVMALIRRIIDERQND